MIGLLMLVLPWSRSAAEPQVSTVNVNSTADDPTGCPTTCTLRSAIAIANSGDMIEFDPGVAGTIELTQTLVIDKDLTINGPGADVLALDGGQEVRVLSISRGAAVSIAGLTIQNGNSTIDDTSGGIDNRGTLTVIACTLSGNSADYGGGITNWGDLTVMSSTFSANSTGYGGGGAILNEGTLIVTDSTFSGNSANGVHGYGGGIYNARNLVITSSTFSGNSADDGYGYGGGIYNDDESRGSLDLGSVIVFGNEAGQEAPDIYGEVNSLGYNLIGRTRGATGFLASDLKNTDPLLALLADNGGPTQTMALLEGSSAIDAGDPENCPATDQRGAPRVGACDIGAYEFDGVVPKE
jgi:CSLREA domain-containing protein